MPIWSRRTFVASTTGMLGSALLSQPSAATRKRLAVSRTTTLFDNAGAGDSIILITPAQDDTIVVFKGNEADHFGIAATRQDGTRLWQYPLPKAFSYAALDTIAGSQNILLQAINLRRPTGKSLGLPLMSLDPATGKSEVLADLFL